MQKLNIVNPTATDLGDALGISLERLNEISDGLDSMVSKAKSGELRLVYAVDVYNHIRSLCNNDEEYTWAINNHMLWLARTGRLFTTIEAQALAINKLGNPQHLTT